MLFTSCEMVYIFLGLESGSCIDFQVNGGQEALRFH